MATRAAVNILGATGAIIDVTSLGTDSLSAEHPSPGLYLIHGTLGMVPPPEGWGYVLNHADNGASVAISFGEGVLTVSVAKDGEPSDLVHSITLHVAVEDLPPVEAPDPLPPPAADLLEEAQAKAARLRESADYAVVPLQDAVDGDEATDAEIAALKAWKKYRVALNRVPEQSSYPGSIEWPPVPE